jgi:hypothetical protein
LTTRFAIDGASLQEISATPSKLPGRTDWTIAFKDTSRALPRGEVRLAARIAGEEIADAWRFVFIPEDWERAERNAQTVATIVQGAGILLGAALAFGGAIAAVISWSRRRFVIKVFLAAFATILVCTAIRFVNAFPGVLAALSTSQPLQLQLAVLLGSSAVGLTLQAAGLALIAGAVPIWLGTARRDSTVALRLGVALGLIAAAARASSALTGGGPVWPSYAGANSFVPFVASAVGPLVTLLSRIVFLMLIVGAANRLSAGWTRHRVAVATLLVIAGGVLGTAASPLNLTTWIFSAVLIGLLLTAAYVVVLRHDVSVVPIAAAVMTTMGTLREGWVRAYSGALAGAIVASILMAAVAFVSFCVLRASTPTAGPAVVGDGL